MLRRFSWKIENVESTRREKSFRDGWKHILTALGVDNVGVLWHPIEEPDIPEDDVLDEENDKSIDIED